MSARGHAELTPINDDDVDRHWNTTVAIILSA
jgi:hypothetical protein